LPSYSAPVHPCLVSCAMMRRQVYDAASTRWGLWCRGSVPTWPAGSKIDRANRTNIVPAMRRLFFANHQRNCWLCLVASSASVTVRNGRNMGIGRVHQGRWHVKAWVKNDSLRSAMRVCRSISKSGDGRVLTGNQSAASCGAECVSPPRRRRHPAAVLDRPALGRRKTGSPNVAGGKRVEDYVPRSARGD